MTACEKTSPKIPEGGFFFLVLWGFFVCFCIACLCPSAASQLYSQSAGCDVQQALLTQKVKWHVKALLILGTCVPSVDYLCVCAVHEAGRG